ncbi:unnamed protein product, partial [Staurois parvus]
MGPPTDPGPSGSAQVSKWSVRPCSKLRMCNLPSRMCFLHHCIRHLAMHLVIFKRVCILMQPHYFIFLCL